LTDYRKMNYSKFGRKPSEQDVMKAKRYNDGRPSKAQAIDNGMSANITPFYQVWITDPARFDMIGVDTKRGNKKSKGIKIFDF